MIRKTITGNCGKDTTRKPETWQIAHGALGNWRKLPPSPWVSAAQCTLVSMVSTNLLSKCTSAHLQPGMRACFMWDSSRRLLFPGRILRNSVL